MLEKPPDLLSLRERAEQLELDADARELVDDLLRAVDFHQRASALRRRLADLHKGVAEDGELERKLIEFDRDCLRIELDK